MKATRLLFSLFLIALFVQLAQAQKMNVQGQVNNADGTPADGEFNVTFRLYTDSLGGTPVLTEAQRLAIASSFFQTSLDVRSIPFDTEYFLGISIDGGDELRPRLPLRPSSSAFSLFGHTNFIPSSGNAGLGTRNPRAPLHVVGDVLFEDLRILPPDSLLPLLVIDTTGFVWRAQPGPFLGINCWDLNGNGIRDPEEDTNSDGLFDALDCRGFDGILQGRPLIVRDDDGNEVFRVNPDGTSFHTGMETFSGGIKSEQELLFEDALRRLGGIVPLPTEENEDLSAEGLWRFEEALKAAEGILSEGDVEVEGAIEVGLETLFGGLRPLPTEDGDRVSATGEWQFEETTRALERFIAENGIDMTGGALTFPDGTSQTTAGGGGSFNGTLENVPLIIRNEDGQVAIQLNPNGTSFHSGLETFASGIRSESDLIFESALGELLGGISPLPSPDPDDLEAEGLWRFEEVIKALEGLTSEGDIELDESNLRMILNNQIVGGLIILPSPEPEDLEAEGLWRFEEAVRMLDGFLAEEDSRVDGTLSADDLEAANEMRAFLAQVQEVIAQVAQVTGDLTVNGNGQFDNDVNVNNLLQADQIQANQKNFRIDHPLDPSGRYLIHTSVESPDMMTVYNGNVTLDNDGAATVEMPSYFEALNKDFRYQLTPIGAPGPNLYVAQEIVGNRFKIAGGTPGMKVSWQVTGVRHDAYAKAYRSPVEVEKPAAEQGTYLHPELYGASPATPTRRESSDQR